MLERLLKMCSVSPQITGWIQMDSHTFKPHLLICDSLVSTLKHLWSQSKVPMLLAQLTGLDLGVNVFIFFKTQVISENISHSAFHFFFFFLLPEIWCLCVVLAVLELTF